MWQIVRRPGIGGWALQCAAAAIFLFWLPGTVSSQSVTTDRFDVLIEEWRATEAGSAEEAAVEQEVRSFVEEFLGGELIDTYLAYLEAPPGSDQEQEAESSVRSGVSDRGISWGRAEELLGAYLRFDPEAAPPSIMNGAYEGPPIHVDVELESTQESAIAGGRFGIMGTITNQSPHPVWIVDRYTTLLPPPEIWGNARGGSLGAFFPSIPAVPYDEVVRIDPQSSYHVIWQLDPRRGLGAEDSKTPLSDFLQFRPGTYRFTAQVHVWAAEPTRTSRNVSNLGDSKIVGAEARLSIGLPVLILIIGGAVGGVLAFVVRLLSQLQIGSPPRRGWIAFVSIGFLGSLTVAVGGTILISRLGAMDSFVTLTINDIWGALATGFLLEWFGLRQLLTHLEKSRADEQERFASPGVEPVPPPLPG